MTWLLTTALVAAVVTLTLMPVVRRWALRYGYLDVPNDRSSHERPTPRVGGYAILAGLFAALGTVGAWRDATVASILAGVLVLAATAFVDDRRGLPLLFRLVLQAGVACFVVWGMGAMSPAWRVNAPLAIVTGLLAVIWIVGFVNVYNFMDGLNGMAGVTAIVAGSTLAVLALRRGDDPAAALALAAAAAGAGFLPSNLFRGSVFMGDAGSTTLGLVFASLTVANGLDPLPIAAALPLAPFVLDAGTTIVRRALRGERFFSTRHRSSYYQLLQQTGWSHAAVAGLYGALAAICAAVALGFDRLSASQQGVALAAVALGHAAIFTAIHHRWSAQTRQRAV